MAQPTRLDELLAGASASLEAAAQRFPIERTGPRTPIEPIVRLLVLKRDKYRCDWCLGWDAPGQPFHLDHIVPWSAGGTDESSNLRLLCPTCNEQRSNYRTDADYARRLPCTPMCTPCGDPDADQSYYEPHEIHRAFCGSCNRASWIVPRPDWGYRLV